jgi:threonine dehydrogenase-like Zn-dependent dehydrogenase
MKAAVMQGIRSIKVEERAQPQTKPGEIVVKIRAAGICGSDYHVFLGPNQERRKPGLIVGHEAAGEVDTIGDGVQGWQIGERVAIDPQITCGICHQCQNGWANLCDNMQVIGSSMRNFMNGAMCEYLSIPAKQLHRLPDNVSYEEGTMLDPVGNALHVFNRSHLKVGNCVAVVGYGADIVLEAVGASQTYEQCIRSVKKRGTVLALGFMEPHISLPIQPILFRELSIIGCTGFVSECSTALNLMENEKIIVKPLITHTFTLDDVQEAFETVGRDDSTKVIVTM